jgi:carbon storage regulator
MLVVSRRIGESLVINGDIEVSVILLQGGKVRLGIQAPPWVTVDRREVHERRLEAARDEADVEPASCI